MDKYKFSENSRNSLNTCNSKIKVLMYSALKTSPIDFTIGCGHRKEEEQNILYERGLTKAKFGESKHNVFPSRAIDIYPYCDGRMCNGGKKGDFEKFQLLSEHIKQVAKKLQINVKWGGDWKNFIDLPHWELEG